MPQAPLPAPAARLSSVPIFQPLNPGTYMDRQPFNVLPYMKYPDMIDHAVKGVQLASMIGKLPREAQENAAQSAMASIAKEQSTAIQARIKAIQQDQTKDAKQKTKDIQDLLFTSGFGYTPTGGTMDPTSALMNRFKMNMDLYGRENVLKGADVLSGTTSGTSPGTTGVTDGSNQKPVHPGLTGQSDQSTQTTQTTQPTLPSWLKLPSGQVQVPNQGQSNDKFRIDIPAEKGERAVLPHTGSLATPSGPQYVQGIQAAPVGGVDPGQLAYLRAMQYQNQLQGSLAPAPIV